MLIEVHFNGSEFVAYTPNGERITDRSVLEAVSYQNFPGVKGMFNIDVDITGNPAIIEPVHININIQDKHNGI